MPIDLELLGELCVEVFEIDLFVGVDLLVVFGDLEVVLDLDLLLGFGFAGLLLVAAVVVALDVWGFGLVDFLEHATGLLCLFQLLLVPHHALAVSETIFLLFHRFDWLVDL